MKVSAVVAMLWLLGLQGLFSQRFVVLETSADGKTKSVGDQALLSGAYPPASLFKLLIAWSALKEGVATPATMHRCADRNGREVTLAEAMYFSSNDYFRWLALQLNRESFDALIREAGWAGKDFKQNLWLAAGPDGTERGGEIKVTAAQVHALTLALMRGTGGDDLKTVMRRPWNDGQSRVYGKSGAWGGAVWMTGYFDAAKPAERKAVTVLVPYEVPHWKPAREKAQVEFYRCLGLPRPPEP